MPLLSHLYSKLRFNYDTTDLVFRALFSLIFLGLGGEHVFDNQLILKMMPDFLPLKGFFSVLCGLVLLTGGGLVLLGYQTRFAATLLGLFLILVTCTVHLPALFFKPEGLPEDWNWLWDVYQRSNFVKNLCLLGVCFHLINHKLGRFSLDIYLRDRKLS